MLIAGCDVGLNGAISILDHDGNLVKMYVMPLTANEVSAHGVTKIFKDHNISMCIIEHAQSMPQNKASAMFNYGTSFGKLLGIMAALDVKYILVKPQRWQAEMLIGTDAKLDTKKRGFLAAQRMWPKETFIHGDRSKKFHDGLTDSILIAEYGRRLISGKCL